MPAKFILKSVYPFPAPTRPNLTSKCTHPPSSRNVSFFQLSVGPNFNPNCPPPLELLFQYFTGLHFMPKCFSPLIPLFQFYKGYFIPKCLPPWFPFSSSLQSQISSQSVLSS